MIRDQRKEIKGYVESSQMDSKEWTAYFHELCSREGRPTQNKNIKIKTIVCVNEEEIKKSYPNIL